ncbi:MAG TPA: hypothetical protein VLZ78_05260 [Terrimesophilobacter sp.]|nr:hypothetical protein [Terrimesophilobacter sp.]
MTEKHRDPEYLRNARIVRAQVRRTWKLGGEVRCWRCGRPIELGMKFDVGHLNPDGGHSLSNLAAECVPCNRRDGGRMGAAITNARRRRSAPVVRPARPARPSTDGLAPW